jgi:putative flippase GtrA
MTRTWPKTCSGFKRWLVFNAVGGMGIMVQMAVLYGLTSYTHLNYLPATGLAVEAAVVHNFFWHEHWTWADRTGGPTSFLSRLLGFHLANGLLSLVGNLVLMRLFVGRLGISCILANGLAITLCSIFNFFAGDRLVFRRCNHDAW